MTTSPARDAADLASLLPIDDPLAAAARLRLDAAVRDQGEPAMHKLTAPSQAQPATCLGDATQPEGHVWLIYGVAYTDKPPVVSYARSAGYAVEAVDEIPAEHLAKVTRVKSLTSTLLGGAMSDGADTNAVHQWPALDGDNRVDMRDVIAGTR